MWLGIDVGPGAPTSKVVSPAVRRHRGDNFCRDRLRPLLGAVASTGLRFFAGTLIRSPPAAAVAPGLPFRTLGEQ